MKKPLVSVIINCLNGEKYLKKCIKSVLNQTYKNFEIIFWDNQSTDASKEILLKFKDQRIRYFNSKKILDLSEARNKAIKVSKGSYITFLDVDDWYIPKKLELQLKEFSKNENIGVICSQYYLHDQINKNKKLIKTKVELNKTTQKLIDFYNIGILTVMINSKILKKIKFEKNFNIIEDFDFIVRSSLITNIKCINYPTAYYRAHENNLSKIKLDTHINELEKWKKNFKKKYKEKFNYYFFDLKVSSLKMKKYLILGKKFLVLKMILNSNAKGHYLKTLGYLFLIFVPNFLAKKILKHRI